jgi:hypothetical protein
MPRSKGILALILANLSGHHVRTGIIDPGVIWAGQRTQFGVEAMIPVNCENGRIVSVITQVHFYLEDIFPTTTGKPLFWDMTMAFPFFSRVGTAAITLAITSLSQAAQVHALLQSAHPSVGGSVNPCVICQSRIRVHNRRHRKQSRIRAAGRD